MGNLYPICGLAFKPNIDDLRESPAVYIAEKIQQIYSNDHLLFVEPNIEEHNKFNLIGFDEAMDKADIVFVLVAHTDFEGIRCDKIISFVNI